MISPRWARSMPPSFAVHMPMPVSRASMSRRRKAHPGVVTVLTGADLLGKVGTVPCGAAGPGMKVPVNHALAVGKVGFVGQPVAVVVANDPYVAEDAVNLIDMDVEVLPAVVDPEQAAQPGTPRVHDEFADNIMFRVFGPAPEPAISLWV